MQDEAETYRDSFVIYSAEKSIKCHLNETELKVQQMLVNGFINNSFIKTIDVLMVLMDFQKIGITKGEYNKENLVRITNLIADRIGPSGSFDNTFGATCKALWYFSTFFGVNDRMTKRIWDYIQEHRPTDASLLRESLNYLSVCHTMGKTDTALQELDTHLVEDSPLRAFLRPRGVRSSNAHYNEYDVLAVLKIGQMTHNLVVLENVLEFLHCNISDGQILNSQLTAAYAHNLIRYHHYLQNADQTDGQAPAMLRAIQDVLFEMIARLKHELQHLMQTDTDNRFVDVQLYIIRTLYEFEAIISFPITDLIDMVYTSGNYPQLMLELKTSIDKVQDSRVETEKYREDIKQYKRYKPFERLFYVLLGVSVALLYLVVLLALELSHYSETGARLLELLSESWPAAFSAVIIPVIAKIYHKVRGDKKS